MDCRTNRNMVNRSTTNRQTERRIDSPVANSNNLLREETLQQENLLFSHPIPHSHRKKKKGSELPKYNVRLTRIIVVWSNLEEPIKRPMLVLFEPSQF